MNKNQPSQQQQQVDMKKVFILEIRNRIEAYFKLIVRNLRDSIPKAIGNNIVRSIEETMQITLYNMLYKSREIVNVLNEPESVQIRRKELLHQIKVLWEAQKIVRRDPDLMQVMQININDSDITGHGKDSRNIHHEEEEPKKEVKESSSDPFAEFGQEIEQGNADDLPF